MRTFIVYIIADYIALLCGIYLIFSLYGLDWFIVILISFTFIPIWAVISGCNKIANLGRFLGYDEISLKRIKSHITQKKEKYIISYCSIWKIHIVTTSILGSFNTIILIIAMTYRNIIILYFIIGIMTIITYYFILLYFYKREYDFHKLLGIKYLKNSYINEGKKAINRCDLKSAQEIGGYYFSQKLDYKNGYRWFFLTWFSAKTPIPVELQQYIDSRDNALIELFFADPHAEDPLEKALFPLWAYIYWTLIGNDDDAREKYYQEAAKIGFDDTQWQLFYPKQISATA